ncbi:MAG TPA: biopolymer transporter ExbD [Gemmatimonadaceae bacterium]|nr:biopolymer transporter ExbD [Gemmatimonadaceae bacterium]
MATRFHAARQRRAERSALLEGQTFNLVPLVDVLVSILFFSLLTYTGATAFLVSFDLSLPPVLRDEAQAPGPQDRELELLLTVRVEENRLLVEHTGSGADFRQEIPGLDDESLELFQAVMTQIRSEFPQNRDVLVIPLDATSYDNIVGVLERLRAARYPNIALGQRRRATQVAAATVGR